MDSIKDKVPPHNVDAEQAVLGALLLDWSVFPDIATKLRSEHFYLLQNQTIFEALLSLNQKNIHGDSLSLMTELTETNNLEKAGGPAYIATLTDTVPSSANVSYYAGIVIDRSVRRELIKLSSEVKAEAFEIEKKSDLILDAAERKIFSLTEKNESTTIYSAKDIIKKDIEIIEARCNNNTEFTGIPSGLSKLDTLTAGFQNSELIIIGARPSIGKTAIALSMMEHIAVTKKIPCGFFSLEMPYESIGLRLLSMTSRVPLYQIRSGMLTKEQVGKIQGAAGRWYDSPFYVCDVPNMRLLELRAMARRMVLKQNVKIIFIDYIGLIATDDPTRPVFEQVSEISKSLKALARELEIPIVVLCQVARDAEGNEPNLAQLRGSGSIEQDADVVMFLHRDRLKEEVAAQEGKIILAKQRNGATGDIPIMYLPSYTKFENKAEE